MQKLYFCQSVNIKNGLPKNALMACLLCAFLLPVNPVAAEVYKCTSVDQATQKAKTVYTDTPCEKSARQKTVDVADPVKTTNQKTPASSLANETVDNEAFNRAISAGDFKKAKALANTKEQWRLIALAEDRSKTEQTSSQIAAQQVIAENSRNESCDQARNDYDVTSRNQWRERDLVAAKKSIMLAACGTAEAPTQPYVVNTPYYGIRSYSTPIYPYGYGWGQPYPHHNHDGNGYTEHTGSGQTSGGSVSLRYNSKNFGVSAESFGVQSESTTTKTFGTQNFGTKIFNPESSGGNR